MLSVEVGPVLFDEDSRYGGMPSKETDEAWEKLIPGK
jgi:hypothetical protein